MELTIFLIHKNTKSAAYGKTTYFVLEIRATFPQHLCYGSPFLPPQSVSNLGAGISKCDPTAAPNTPSLRACAALKLSRGRWIKTNLKMPSKPPDEN